MAKLFDLKPGQWFKFAQLGSDNNPTKYMVVRSSIAIITPNSESELTKLYVSEYCELCGTDTNYDVIMTEPKLLDVASDSPKVTLIDVVQYYAGKLSPERTSELSAARSDPKVEALFVGFQDGLRSAMDAHKASKSFKNPLPKKFKNIPEN
jgi:hypothetical protein